MNSPPTRTVYAAATPLGVHEDGTMVEPSPAYEIAVPRLTPQPRQTAVPVRHRRLPGCGHRFTQGREPRHRNCESCWFTFFQVHGEVAQTADEILRLYGPKALAQQRGDLFLIMFQKFMSTLALWKKQAIPEATPDGL